MIVHLGRAGLLAMAVLFAGSSVLAAEPTGLWLTQRQDAKVRVTSCGNNLICGTVAWLRDPVDSQTGKPQTDDKNPNPGLQNRPIIGLRLFSLSMRSPNTWTGKIYNADDGQQYDATVTYSGANTLNVQGCAGPFCGMEVWTRTK